MYLKPGQNFYLRAYTISPTTAAPTNADSLPTAVLLHNGAVDGAVTLTVTNVATGTYKIAGTVPNGYVEGDFCQVEFASTVGGVAASIIPDSGTWIVETAYNADIAATVTTTNTRALLALPNVAPGANGGLPTSNASNKVAAIVNGTTDLTGVIPGTVLANVPTGSGGGLDASGIRAAVGLNAANLDTQLGAIAGYIDTEVGAIKAKTDGLSATPAADVVAALKADTEWKLLVADVNGVWDFNETTHVLTLKDKTGTTLMATLTLTPGANAFTHRASA